MKTVGPYTMCNHYPYFILLIIRDSQTISHPDVASSPPISLGARPTERGLGSRGILLSKYNGIITQHIVISQKGLTEKLL